MLRRGGNWKVPFFLNFSRPNTQSMVMVLGDWGEVWWSIGGGGDDDANR